MKSENNKNLIYLGLGLVGIVVLYKYISKQKNNNIATIQGQGNKNRYGIKQQGNEPKEELKDLKYPVVKYGDINDDVYLLKRIINFFSKNTKVELTNVYDVKTLNIVQKTMQDNPALLDYNSGAVCLRMIKNIDYLMKRIRGYQQNRLDYDSEINTCDLIKKGNKGVGVLKLQKLVNLLHGIDYDEKRKILEENGKYSRNMDKIIEELFDGTQVLKQDENGGVCLMFVNTSITFIENLKRIA